MNKEVDEEEESVTVLVGFFLGLLGLDRRFSRLSFLTFS